MGTSKIEKFTRHQNELALIAKAFSHPARIAILEHLFKIKSCVCGDLVQEIGLAQATISQHLKALKETGIIKGEIEGTSVCYCINNDKWHDIKQLLNNFFNQNTNKNNCC